MIPAVPVLLLFFPSDVFCFQVTLSWVPPSTNVDGTPLSDLAGYKVYYGTASRSYSKWVNVKNVTTYTVSNLSDGPTYYFAVTAYDTAGNESDYSNEVARSSQSVAQAGPRYSVTVAKAGTGSGTVTATGINCGTDCSESYPLGAIITLRATSSSGSLFSGWSGGGCSGTGTCTISVTGNVAITAGFAPASPPPEMPNIVISPAFLNFGNVKTGWTVTGAVKITNTGRSVLRVAAPGIDGLDAAMFGLRTSSPVTLNPGSSAYVKVRFTPTSLGRKSATLRIASNDPDTPVGNVSLSGMVL